MDPWREALSSSLAKADISSDEQIYLEKTTKEDLVRELTTADEAHRVKSIGRTVSKRMAPLVDCILQYSSAIDVMSNIDPVPVCVVWGAVKIVLQLAKSFEKYFDKLVAMFERISDILPRFDLYLRLFPDRKELMASMSRLYCDVVQFCLKARHVFKVELKTPQSKFAFGTSIKVAWKNCWKDFELQFGDLLERFREHKDHVEAEAKAAAMEDSQARLVRLEVQNQNQTLAIREVQYFQGETARGKASVEWERLMAWLGGGIESELTFRKHVAARYDGTGGWLLEHAKFKNWFDADGPAGDTSNILWCYGPAGIGKTSLCSYVIDQLSFGTLTNPEGDRTTTLYHFCDFRNHASTRSTNILGNILHQALKCSKHLKGHYKELLQTRQYRGEDLIGDDFADNLEEIFTKQFFGGHMIIIDALDECIDSEQILQRLLRCAKTRRIKLLIISRDFMAARNHLDAFPTLALSSDLLENDVKEFVSKEVSRLVQDNVLKTRDKQLPASLADELSKRAQGMFLWAKLQLESISRKHTDRAIRGAISQLPQGLVTSYQRTVSSLALLPDDEQELMKQLLRWIVCSVRPMTATELSVCLLAIDTETGMLDEENIVADVADLSSLASGLLVFDSSQVEDESALVVSHRSVQDFLMSPSAGDFKVDGASSHLHVAMVSLKYLLIPNFDTVCTSWDDLTDRFITFPFLDYAARCWSFQVAKVATITPELLSAMMTLFMGPNFLPWLQVFKSDRNVPNYLTFHVDAKPLYWAARLGLKDLVDHILKSGVDVNESGGFFGTPLTMAAYNGDLDMVKLLLAKGADVNRPAGHYHTALQAAAFTGSDAIVELLLNSGADLNARGGFFSTPLIAAEKAGHQPIVNRLLDLGLQHPTQAPDPADSAEFLGSAILRSDAPAVRRILQTGLDVNARLPGFSNWRKEDPNSGHSHYPLILAISSSSLEVIQLIIDAGADLDVSDGYHGSALAYAAYRGSKDVVYALLQGGANPMVGRYSGSRLPRFIQELEPAQRDKMNKGKGLNVWVEERTDGDAKSSSEAASIANILKDGKRSTRVRRSHVEGRFRGVGAGGFVHR